MASPSALPHQLYSLLASLVEDQANVRNGVLLVEGSGFKWKGACGMAFPEEAIPMLPDDQFNIDSIAKMMTATIVMKLVEANELTLEDKISRFLPGSIIDGLHILDSQSYGEIITIAHLLSHTSGIADDWTDPRFLDLIIADPHRRWMPEETIEYVKQNCNPKFRPGSGFQYSDPGYNLLGLIIEAITGVELHIVYRELILDPLGMEYTYRPSHEIAKPRFPSRTPSQRYLDDMECTLLPAVMTADWAGGGLISNTEDLLLFMRAFVRDEIFKDPTTIKRMFEWVTSGSYHNYGLGISRVLFDKSANPAYEGLGEVWGHTGSSDNFMYYWPEGDMILIGTLNQLNCTRDLYDNIAMIIRIIQNSTT